MKHNFTFLFVILTIVLTTLNTNHLLAQPTNDECSTATLLTVSFDSTNCITATNVGATTSIGVPNPYVPGDPNGYTGYTGGDIWFKFVAPETQKVYIKTSSTDAEANGVMALYSGNCNGLTQQILSIPDENSGTALPQINTDAEGVILTENTVYFIRFWSFDNIWHGSFNLCIWTEIVAVGDNCAEATELSVDYECNYRIFNNEGSTHSGTSITGLCGSYNASSTRSGDIWFKATVPPNGIIVISTEAMELNDCAMALYKGSDCGHLQRVVCNDGVSAGNPMPEINSSNYPNANLIPGSTVWIRFWDKDCNDVGTFKICAYTTRPSNDDCAWAMALSAPLADTCSTVTFNTFGATPTYNLQSECANYQDGDLWYTVQALAGYRLVITTAFGTAMNAGIALYELNEGETPPCSRLYEIDCQTGVNPGIEMQGFQEDKLLYVRLWTIGQEGTYGICAYHTEEATINMGETRFVYSDCNENNSIIICDNGGSVGDYGSNRNDTITIFSDDPTSSFVEIELLTFDVDSTDTLFIYNASVAEPEYLVFKLGNAQASWLNNNNAPIISEGFPLKVSAFYYGDTTGAITLRFKSDADSTGTGFRVKVTCTQPCKPLFIDKEAMDSLIVPLPEIDPSYNDGFHYIDVCPSEENHDSAWVHFKAAVNYPISPEEFYPQHDTSSTFTWYIGKEKFSGKGLTELDYPFTPGQGISAALSVVDSRGCFAPNVAVYRVRVSGNPIIGVSVPDICAGEYEDISLGYGENSNFQAGFNGGGESTSLTVSDTVFLPDGDYCEPYGCSYVSPVVFTAFAPNAVVRTADDILFIRALIEHSFVGDLYMRLTCPNGNYAVILKKYTAGQTPCSSSIPPEDWGWQPGSNSSGADLGVPINLDGNGCEPTPMGVGWNYCWSNATDRGYEYADGDGIMYRSSHVHGGRIDSTNTVNMTNVYHPDQPFTGLIGCPLNGVWSFEIMDGWGADDGYIFEWELALTEDLLPTQWAFEDSAAMLECIDCPFTTTINDTILRIAPPCSVPDTIVDFLFRVTDKFGCHYDTSVNVHIFPSYGLPGCESELLDEICQGLPYEGNGFSIPNPPASSNGEDTTIYVQKYSLKTIHGCDSALTLALTIHPNKEVFFTGSICEGETYNEHGFNVNGYAIGDWIYRNVGVTQYGCDTIATLYLDVASAPDAEIMGVTNICKGASTTLIAMGGSENSTYLWNTGATTSSITVAPEEDAYYSVQIFNSAGCFDETGVTVYVGAYPLPDVHIEGNLNIQCGSSTTLTAIDNNNVGTIFEWRANGEIIEGANASTITVMPTATTSYSVYVVSEFNCSNSALAIVTVESNEISISGDKNIYCGESTILTVEDPTQLLTTYQWYKDGTPIEGENASSITVSPNSNATYSVHATTDNGCESFSEESILVEENIISITATKDSIIYGETTTLTTHHGDHTAFTYQWYLNEELLENETGQSLLVVSNSDLEVGDVVFKVIATTFNGCASVSYITINIHPYLATPQEPHSTEFSMSITATCQAMALWLAPNQDSLSGGGEFLGYNVYRDNDIYPLNTSLIQPDSLFYIDPNTLTEGVYVYCISAVYEFGESNKVCAAPLYIQAEYNEPTNITSTRTENCAATLIWTSPEKNCWANLNGYYIYRDGKLIDSVYTPNPLDTIFVDENIGEKNSFEYCIQAFYKVKDQTRVSDKICGDVNTCFNVAVNVYPNPADNEVTIVANEMERIMIYDESGRFIRQVDVSETNCRTITISTAHLASGVHIFHIFMKGDISSIKRVIIMH